MTSNILQDHPELEPFILTNVQLTGRRIGGGAYGSVEEIAIPGAICAAKRLHEVFLDRSEMPEEDILRSANQFVRECQLMSTLRHPHIVQFLGVCFLPGSRLPALVMERLTTSLHDLLESESLLQPETSKPFFPISLKCSILHQVACGLAYLHERSPPVIHRDLSARNVLLSSGMVAKIADLGVARIVAHTRAAATMTKGPGAIVYMPQEALEDKPDDENDDEEKSKAKYSASIDIFSFGVVSIFTLCQSFPEKLLAPNYREGDLLKARTELERRERYMRMIYSQLREKHPLLQMIEGCLDFPEGRPGIREVLRLLEEARAEEEDEQGDMNKLELLQIIHNQPKQQQGLSGVDEELARAQQRLRQMEEVMLRSEMESQRARQELTTVQQQLTQTEEQLQLSEREKLTLQRENITTQIQLREKEMQLNSSEKEKQLITQDLILTRDQLQQMQEQLQSTVSEKDAINKDLALMQQRYREMVEWTQSTKNETVELQQQLQRTEHEKQRVKEQFTSSQRTWMQEMKEKEQQIKSNESKKQSAIHIREAELAEAQKQLKLKDNQLQLKQALLAEAFQEKHLEAKTKLHHSNFPLSTVKATKLTVQCHLKETSLERMNRGSATSDSRFAYFAPSGSTSVFRYQYSTDKWDQLPSSNFCGSGLAIIEGNLTAVGGYSGSNFTNKLVTLRRGKWVEEYPPMITAHSSPAVVSAYNGAYIIVIGGGQGANGSNGGYIWTKKVELLRIQVKTRVWCCLNDIPQPLHRPSAIICGDRLNLIGSKADGLGYSCSLQSLLSSPSHPVLQWEPLPPLPVSESTAATLCGQLLTVGGWQGQSPVNSIYQQVDGEWVEICCMSSSRWYCLVASLSPDRMVIVGGMAKEGCIEECSTRNIRC